MNIYIPSRSRYDIKSLTIERIEGGWPEEKIFLVVPAKQAKQYEKQHPNRGGIAVLACPAEGIARTREWIGANSTSEKFLMLDDDLRFFYRPRIRPIDDPLGGGGEPNENPARLYRAPAKQMTKMFRYVESLLDKYKHVAIGAREGNNRQALPLVECSRPLRALAYQREAFNACEHGRVAIMEDFDITLQLLRMGFKNAITTCFAQDQYATQLSGGCSDYRTHELHETNVRKFAQLHEGFVRLKQQRNKHGGTFGKRLEATMSWVAAYKSAFIELGLLDGKDKLRVERGQAVRREVASV